MLHARTGAADRGVPPAPRRVDHPGAEGRRVHGHRRPDGDAGELLHLRFGGHALMNATQSNLPAYLPEGLPIPTPESDSLSAPYWNGLKESVLMVQRCRSEERRVGKECVSTCSSRWSPLQ